MPRPVRKNALRRSAFNFMTAKPLQKVLIPHIQKNGVMIVVSKLRQKRIERRRRALEERYRRNPMVLAPYQFRFKGPKHKSRSDFAKKRGRDDKGRFFPRSTIEGSEFTCPDVFGEH